MSLRASGTLVFVRDFPRMRDFYRALFEREPVNTEWTDRWAEFDLGGTHFALHAIPEDHLPVEPCTRARENAPVKFLFETPDIERERKRVESLGAKVLERPWGAWDGVDLEGNVFGIVQARGAAADAA